MPPPISITLRILQLTPQQGAQKSRQRKKTVIWFVLFGWLNETYQINQINQINKTNRSTRRAMLDEDGLFEHPACGSATLTPSGMGESYKQTTASRGRMKLPAAAYSAEAAASAAKAGSYGVCGEGESRIFLN